MQQENLLKNQYKFNTDVVSRKNQDGTFILMKMDDSDKFYKIDGLAANLVDKIQEGQTTVEQAVNEVHKETSAPMDRLRDDSANFVSKLIDSGFIVQA